MTEPNYLLCLCCSFPPEVTPTSIRSGKILSRLAQQWSIDVITAVEDDRSNRGIAVHCVKPWERLNRLMAQLARYRLDKIPKWFVWPDESIFWVVPAAGAAGAQLKRRPARAIVVFMMPYSAGLVGIWLKRRTGLPLVLNMDDALTCTDMHPLYQTRMHYLLNRKLEDWYIRQADAAIYVSQFNLEMVRSRQRPENRSKFHLVRYGSDPADYLAPPKAGRMTPAMSLSESSTSEA